MFGAAAGMGLQVVAGIAKGIISAGARRKYIEQLGQTELHMPKAIGRADSIYSDMAGSGLAGLETMEGDIGNLGAQTMTKAKDVATSSGALLNALTKVNTNESDQLRQLGVKDAQTKDVNSQMLARFLGTIKAPAQTRIDQFEADKKIAIAKERMQMTKDVMTGISGGLGAGMMAYGQGKQLEFQGEKHDMMMDFWNKQGDAGGGGGAMAKLQQMIGMFANMQGK